MMNKFIKGIALLMTVCGIAGAAQAANLSVGTFAVQAYSTRFNEGSDYVFWVGKCHLNRDDDPLEKFKDAVPLEADYHICYATQPSMQPSYWYGTGYSAGGFVKLKANVGAVFDESNFAEGDCVYIVETFSTDPVTSQYVGDMKLFNLGIAGMEWNFTDDLPEGYDGKLRGGKFWYAKEIKSNLGTVSSYRRGFVSLCLDVTVLPDPLWQCRIGDVNYKALEAALEAANAGDTIYLKRDVNLTNNVTIAKNVTIATEDGGMVAVRRLGDYSLDIAANVVLTNVTVNGLGFEATRAMINVADGATLTLATDVTVNSCVNTSGDGGAIASSGTVTLDGGRIVSSSAAGHGGAISAAGGVVTARAGEIAQCAAAQGGGAVYLAEGASMTLAGNFRATDNMADEAANNIQPTGAAQLTAAADFKGQVGVCYPAADVAARGGVSFGTAQNLVNVASHFVSDVEPETFSAAVESDGRLVWNESSWNTPVPVVMGAVALESLAVTGAETKRIGEDVVLIFTNTAAMGTFTIPSNTYARILCVGGGAAGGTVGLGVTKGAGGGGGAGGFYELSTVLKPGSYEVNVGAGAVRVDSYAQSWVGNNGGASWLRRADDAEGNYLMSAKGGGGGGAPKDNGRAVDGGSGGGGSWWGSKALAAGSPTDGYGWNGAKPKTESVGGGGGGAAVAAADGKGRETGEGGAGRTNDITGETVVYAAGGNGGRRLDAAFVPQDGATPGSGGDGAGQPGKGGAGADGIVVVRLTKAFVPVKVPYPVFNVGVPWADGETVCPFGDELVASTNRFFIADAKGTFEVDCSAKGKKKIGIGRYAFTVTLKEGYVWDDGTADGDSYPKTFFWRVKDPGIEGQATSEVTKTVSWSEGTNATIHIEAQTQPETITAVPRVLVLGTLCDAHNLTPQTVKTCLDTAAEVADVDYYFYTNATDAANVKIPLQGELTKGSTFEDMAALEGLFDSPQHMSLYGFYDIIAQQIGREDKTYDYIILCFDRSHVADEFPGTHPREAEVAAFLKPFYADERVVWLVDNESPGIVDESPVVWMTPWYPSQFKCITMNKGKENESIYWISYYLDLFSDTLDFYRESEMSAHRQEAWNIHKALFGMFDPEAYETLDEQVFYDNLIVDMRTFTPEQVAATSGRVNPNQVVYDDAGMVGDIVRRVIQPVSYTIKMTDAVNIDAGLELDGVTGTWAANDKNGVRYELIEGETLFPTETGASVEITNVNSSIWIWLDLHVHDTGRFRTSIGATYDARTGKWQKDPNDGPVTIKTLDVASDTQTTEDQVTTQEGWTFLGYNLTGTVESNTNGLNTGDIVVNGYSTNWVAVGANSSPQTVFRAAPGYILEKVMIDGEEVSFNIATCEWTFPYVNTDHDVKVWYKPYFVENPPPPVTGPVTNVYDGTGYGPTVTNVCFSEDIPYPWYPVYSMESNGVYTVDGGQTNVVYDADGNIIPTNVYVRIAVLQPGYEDPVILDNWTGINEVTILPREVTVTFDNYTQTDDTPKTGDFPWRQTDGELVDGDEITVPTSACTEYPEKGEHTDGTITSEQIVVVDADGNPSGNYIIHVEPGDYYYPDYVLVAEAEGVEKIYDGKPSTIEVVPTTPNLPSPSELKQQYNGPDYAYIGNVTSTGVVIKYSNDGGLTYTLDEPPEYTDTGTYTVPYQVTYAYTFDHGTDADHTTSQTVTYNTVTGTEDVIIHPREVTVTFDNYVQTSDTRKTSGFTWEQTGGELVDGDTINVPGSTCTSYPAKGNHTDDSITANGTVTVRDADGNVNDNYIVHVVPGDYYYPNNEIIAEAKGIEKIYDGARSTIEVTPTVPDLPMADEIKAQHPKDNNYKNVSTPTSNGPVIKYSADGGKTYTLDAPPDYLNVGTNTVYYQVEYSYSFKHGQKSASTLETVTFNKVTGQADVIIHPREVTVTFDNYVQTDDTRKEGDFSWSLTEGELVDGDEIDVPGSTCTDYPEKGGHTDDTITADGTVAVVDGDGEPNGNYIVHVVPGDYYWPDQTLVAEAEGVTKVYDGEPSTITVTATAPPLPTAAELKKRYGGSDYAYVGNVTSSGPVIMYSADGGETFTLTEPPEYTDAGTHTVPYQVTYSYTFDHGTDAEHASPRTVTFNTATGSADVIITPRPVYVMADSDAKFYDGTALTDDGYTVAEPTETTGFVEGEGATFQMTGNSSQTLPGTTANKIDPNAVVAQTGTDIANYEFHYIDGTLTVKDRLATVPESVEKVYNGEPSTIGVEVELTSGTPIGSGDYTIKYSLYPDDPESWTNELSFVNVGVSNKVYYVVEGEGYDPVTNFAYVTILPREIVVTAEDKVKLVNTEDPEFTWTVTGGTNGLGETVGILPGEEELVWAAVSNDVNHVIVRPTAKTTEGEAVTPDGEPGYPIVPGGSEYVGNYHVTYVPGELRIVNQRVIELWIVDHADAGRGKTHLAFEPTFNYGTLTADTIKEMKITVKCARSITGLADATSVPVVLRDGTGTQNLDRGWVWITVDVPDLVDTVDSSANLLWKIEVSW